MNRYKLLPLALCLVSSLVAHTIILEDEGTPVLGITYPTTWDTNLEEYGVQSMSADGFVWSSLRILQGVRSVSAGVLKARLALTKEFESIKFLPIEAGPAGTQILRGRGVLGGERGPVNFVVGIFPSKPHWLGEVVFVIDEASAEIYEETIRRISGSIRPASDLTASPPASHSP